MRWWCAHMRQHRKGGDVCTYLVIGFAGAVLLLCLFVLTRWNPYRKIGVARRYGFTANLQSPKLCGYRKLCGLAGTARVPLWRRFLVQEAWQGREVTHELAGDQPSKMPKRHACNLVWTNQPAWWYRHPTVVRYP